MNNHYISLELAKRMAELNFKQDSVWFWIDKFLYFKQCDYYIPNTLENLSPVRIPFKGEVALDCYCIEERNIVQND